MTKRTVTPRTVSFGAPDLTQRPPRSPRSRLGGYSLLPRMLDKGRATLAGTNGEYHYNCPLDQRFLSFVGIDPKKLLAEQKKGKGDGEILEWIQTNAKHKRAPWEIQQWSDYMDRRGPDSDAETLKFFAEYVAKLTKTREDIKTWADVLVKPLTLGGEGPGADLDNFAVILRTMFGAKIKLVTGYPGGSEMNLAIERGEVDGRCGWSWDSIKSTRPDWLRDRKLNLLVAFALAKTGDVPPEVPLIMDMAKTEEQRTILRVHLAGQYLGRPFFAPPGIPDDRKQALRKAFDAAVKDPEFLAEAEKAELEVNPVSGAEIDRVLADLYRTPKEVAEKAKKALKEN